MLASLDFVSYAHFGCRASSLTVFFFSYSQKWSKGKLKEKVNNQVLFDKVCARGRLCIVIGVELKNPCRHNALFIIANWTHPN